MGDEPGPSSPRQSDDEVDNQPGHPCDTGNGQPFPGLTDDAFLALYDQLALPTFHYVRSFVRPGRLNDADAEDILQDGWLALDQARKHKRIRNPRRYLYRTLRRAVYSHLRKTARLPVGLRDPALITDHRAVVPDQLGAEIAERELTARQDAEANAWRDRFRRGLVH